MWLAFNKAAEICPRILQLPRCGSIHRWAAAGSASVAQKLLIDVLASWQCGPMSNPSHPEAPPLHLALGVPVTAKSFTLRAAEVRGVFNINHREKMSSDDQDNAQTATNGAGADEQKGKAASPKKATAKGKGGRGAKKTATAVKDSATGATDVVVSDVPDKKGRKAAKQKKAAASPKKSPKKAAKADAPAADAGADDEQGAIKRGVSLVLGNPDTPVTRKTTDKITDAPRTRLREKLLPK